MLAHTLFCFFALVVPASAHWDTNSSASDNVSSATSANFSVSTTATASAASQSSSNSTSSDSASSLSTNSIDSTEKATKNPKRGLSFPAANNPADVLNINQTRSVVSWTYDWSITPPDYLADTGVEYVPMQWGAGNIESLASIMSKTGAKTLLVCTFLLAGQENIFTESLYRPSMNRISMNSRTWTRRMPLTSG